MKNKALLIYPGSYDDEKERNGKTYEPIQLLTLKTIFDNYQYETKILDTHILEDKNPKSISNIIEENHPSFLGLTTFGRNSSIEYINDILNNIDESIKKEMLIVLGGPGATYNTKKLALGIPDTDIIVKGEGETVLEYILKNGIKKNTLAQSNDQVIVDNINGKQILKPLIFSDINYNYERPYDLKDYGYLAMPYLQRGCIGQCTFCVGRDQKKIRYTSPKIAADEIEYLISEKGAETFLPYGPDFTSNPNAAGQIIREINSRGIVGKTFVFVVRIDSLFLSLEKYSEDRNHFIENNDVQFQIGIESFNREKLLRLGKFKEGNKFLDDQDMYIEKILNTYNASFNAFLILFDPLSTKEEIIYDVEKSIKLLNKYGDKFILIGKIFNFIEIEEGTLIADNYESNWTNFVSEDMKQIFSIADKFNQDFNYKGEGLAGSEFYLSRSREQIDYYSKFLEAIKYV